MKKLFLGLVVTVLLFTTVGCEKVEKGDYKEGTYYAGVVDNYGGKENVASVVLYVNENGMIKSVFIDTTYDSSTGGNSTKKTLGADYAMKTKNPAASGEWDEQMEKLEAEIIAKQGIDFLNLTTDGKTDAVAGVTIKIDAIYEALKQVINKAK